MCSGGRYDDLAGHYTSTHLTGVGISIGLSRLFYKLREAGVIVPNKQSLANVIVISLSDGQISQALGIASQLRAADVPVILYTEPGSMKKKMKYADRMGCEYVMLIGENEAATNTVTLKNMSTGESRAVGADEVASAVAHQCKREVSNG